LKKGKDGKVRVIIENVYPNVDCGRFPVKRALGDTVGVRADLFADGHEAVGAVLLYRHESERGWTECAMVPEGNDRFASSFTVEKTGRYLYSVKAWVDHFATWHQGLIKKKKAETVSEIDLLIGAEMARSAAERAKTKKEQERLREYAGILADPERRQTEREECAASQEFFSAVDAEPDLSHALRYEPALELWVEREKAVFSTWYEMFPRSAGSPGRHGTFKDCMKRLPVIADMGFDVLYFPPIHPIGKSFRKGRNNALRSTEKDPGSPWAIGSEEGGHKSIHPELGSLQDFKTLVKEGRRYGIEIALDIAFQCSPDHPYVKEHPEWFTTRPDGSIQYAENPPKKYEDIYPLNFESDNWQELWEELKSVFVYWINAGVSLFRVDNPHTKSFHFWEWCLSEIKQEYPDVIMLSEAFTRPKRMYHLAKIGFSQSYTYFTWRNEKQELGDYFTELFKGPAAEFFRPNLWPNTPDILHEYLQKGGRPAFIVRYILAAMLSSNCGIYGPAYELLRRKPREAGSEEYLNSEKYEIKEWNVDEEQGIADIIKRVNVIRRKYPALQRNDNFRIHATDNPHIFCFSKSGPDGSASVMTVVNLDYRHTQSAWCEFSPAAVGLPHRSRFAVEDLLDGERYEWKDYWNYVQLDPHHNPAHIFILDTE
jgi:starch synthase (maltosyl-transferring)